MSTSLLRGSATTAAALGAVIALAACSSDSSTSSSTTSTSTGSSSTSSETVRFDKEIQQELIDVSCYDGTVDGDIGPETDAAIVAFQKAEGLETDGEVGPETERALTKAVDAGDTVCDGSGGGGTPTGTCTAQSLSEALDGATITTSICSEGYAAGADVIGGGEADAAFLLQLQSGKWVSVAGEVCGAASAGVPTAILAAGCVS